MVRHQNTLCHGWSGTWLAVLVGVTHICSYLAPPAWCDPPPSPPSAEQLSPEPASQPIAAQSQAKSAEIDAQIQNWVGELSSSEYAVRRRAFLELWKQGPVALPAVRQALSTSDQQTISTAKVLENLLSLDITPSENDDLAELLQLSPTNWEATLRSVGQKGYWRLAADVMRSQATLLQSIRETYQPNRFCKLIQSAFDQGDVYQGWPVVAQGLNSERRFFLTELTRKQLQQQYKDQIPEEFSKHLKVVDDEAALNVDERALLYLYTGREQAAWDLNPSPRAKLRIINHSGRWEWLKDTNVSAMTIAAGANSPFRSARLAAYNRLARDDAKSAETIAALRPELEKLDLSEVKNSSDGSLQDLLKSLIVCGEGELVDNLIARHRVTVDVDYLTYRLQHDKVFKKFGLDDKLNDFDDWLVELPGKLNPNGPQVIGGSNRLDSYLELTRFMAHTGFPGQAQKLYVTLLDSVHRLPMREGLEKWNELLVRSEDHQIRQYLLSYLDDNDSKLKTEERRFILARVFSDWENTSEKLWQHAPAELSEVDGKPMRWRLLERLWKYDLTLVKDEAAAQKVEDWLTKAVRESAKGEEATDVAVGELAPVALKLGMRRQALAMVRTETTRQSLADMAEMLTANNSFDVAGKWWEAAIGQLPDQHMWIRRYADVLIMQGEAEIASKYESSIWLRPLGNQPTQTDEMTYSMIAEKYFESGNYDLAQQYAEVAVALCDLGEQGWRARRMAAMAIEREDYTTAARGSRIYILNLLMSSRNVLRSSFDTLQHYLYFVGQELLANAASDLQAGRIESAMNSIRNFEDLLPSGIEICEHCYPLLVKAGQQEAADQLLDRCSKRMLKHLEAWPDDSNSHNNFAWMLARCNVRLSEAIEHATKAVELSNRAPTYVDTLAEAEFLAGHVDRAIELARECTESDPRHAHFQKQLVRFRAGTAAVGP